MKKCGVLTDHFNQLGGGTVHSFKLIEFLKPHYDVDVFLPGLPKEKEWMKDFLNLDTKGLNFYKFKPEMAFNNYDLFLNISHWRIVETNAKKKFANIFFPQFFFPTYDYTLLANSQYTKKNIITRWGIPEDMIKVLYPPIMTKEFNPSKKTNTIIHVSRIAKPRPEADKGHKQMITAFKEMVDSGLKNWHFYVVGEIQDPEYYNELVSMSKDYPIKFFVSIPFNELKKLYGEAKIYWHMTGITMPNQLGAQEHFGMTTVEAMSSGCVPVTLNSGGQPEIVHDGLDGYLVNDVGELKDETTELIENQNKLRNMSSLAIRRSKDFDEEVIKKKFYNIINI